jgi:crossover junction endodeoxyribonuclease RuvC
MIKTIGIDPGLAGTGIGIVTGTGIKVHGFSYCSIPTSKLDSLPHRLDKIHSALLRILKDEQPDCMILEAIFSLDRYPKSGIMLGKVAGVILLAGCQADIPVKEIPVREAKQILTGNGNASKQQLETAVRHVLHQTQPIRPFHASDAISLALIGLFRYSHHMKKA